MLPADLRKKIEEEIKLIEEGKETYGSVARKYGVRKSTVHYIHEQKLRREIEQLKALIEEYERNVRHLEKEIEEKRKVLGELEELMRVARGEAERLGMSFEEFIELLREVRNFPELESRYQELKSKKEALEREIETLNSELEELRKSESDLTSELNSIRRRIGIEKEHLEKILNFKRYK